MECNTSRHEDDEDRHVSVSVWGVLDTPEQTVDGLFGSIGFSPSVGDARSATHNTEAMMAIVDALTRDPRTSAIVGRRALHSAAADDDALEEEVLPDDHRCQGGVLDAMLREGAAAGGEGWREAAKVVTFDNFFDIGDEAGDDGVPVAAPAAEKQPQVSQPPRQQGVSGERDHNGCPNGVESHSDESESDDEDPTDCLPEGEIDAASTAHPHSSAVLESSPLATDTEFVDQLRREVVDRCDDTIVPFALDAEFDYESNILGKSRRV